MEVKAMEYIQNFFVTHIVNPYIATFIVAMLPIFELRGAIPFGMSTALWGAKALNTGSALLIAFVASSLVIPIVALVFKPFLNFLKRTKLFRNIALKFEKRLTIKSKKFLDKNTRLKKFFGIMCFVAVPLPLTGVYTGTALAIILNMPFFDTLISTMIGNLLAGIIIAVCSAISPNFANIILGVFVVIFVSVILIYLLKLVIGKIKDNQKSTR